VIANIGFKTELGQSAEEVARLLTPALCIVQDADRLDAIGAIGIARCFTFGGAKHRPLWEPEIAPTLGITKVQYQDVQRNSSTLNHFDEKLFLLVRFPCFKSYNFLRLSSHDLSYSRARYMYGRNT
jgi:uncharacterized protein